MSDSPISKNDVLDWLKSLNDSAYNSGLNHALYVLMKKRKTASPVVKDAIDAMILEITPLKRTISIVIE